MRRERRSPRILFIGGSINQTTQMHQIADELPECEPAFTPYYVDGWLELGRKVRALMVRRGFPSVAAEGFQAAGVVRRSPEAALRAAADGIVRRAAEACQLHQRGFSTIEIVQFQY